MSTTVKLQSSANFKIFKYSHSLLVPERFLAKCLHGISQHLAPRCTPRAWRDSKMYRNLYFILPYNTAYSNTIYIYIHLKVLYETRYYSLFRSFPFSQHCQCQSHFTCNPQVCFGSSRCDMYIASDQCHHWSAAWWSRLEPAQQVSPNALKIPKAL